MSDQHADRDPRPEQTDPLVDHEHGQVWNPRTLRWETLVEQETANSDPDQDQKSADSAEQIACHEGLLGEAHREAVFVDAFNAIASDCHETSVDKGFWDSKEVLADAFEATVRRLGNNVKLGPDLRQVVIDTMGQFGLGDGPTNLAKAMLIVTEIAEFAESDRKESKPDEHCPEFTNHEIELADAVIRIMDLAQARGYRLAEAIVAKRRFNTTRPHKHGKTC